MLKKISPNTKNTKRKFSIQKILMVLVERWHTHTCTHTHRHTRIQRTIKSSSSNSIPTLVQKKLKFKLDFQLKLCGKVKFYYQLLETHQFKKKHK